MSKGQAGLGREREVGGYGIKLIQISKIQRYKETRAKGTNQTILSQVWELGSYYDSYV